MYIYIYICIPIRYPTPRHESRLELVLLKMNFGRTKFGLAQATVSRPGKISLLFDRTPKVQILPTYVSSKYLYFHLYL